MKTRTTRMKSGVTIILGLMVLTSCGKKKDELDILEVQTSYPSGSTIGAEVKVYDGADNLKYTATIDQENSDYAYTLIQPGEMIATDNYRFLITLGDSLSNLNGSESSLHHQPIMNEKETDHQAAFFSLQKNYYPMLKGTTWYLTSGKINGVEGTPEVCMSDNTISFSDVADELFYEIQYFEGSDVCAGAQNQKLYMELGSFFNSDSVDGVSSQSNNLNGWIVVGGENLPITNIHIVDSNTLVLEGTNSSSQTVTYYFTK